MSPRVKVLVGFALFLAGAAVGASASSFYYAVPPPPPPTAEETEQREQEVVAEATEAKVEKIQEAARVRTERVRTIYKVIEEAGPSPDSISRLRVEQRRLEEALNERWNYLGVSPK